MQLCSRSTYMSYIMMLYVSRAGDHPMFMWEVQQLYHHMCHSRGIQGWFILIFDAQIKYYLENR